MSFKNMTPEQRLAAQQKSAETRRLKKRARADAVAEAASDPPPIEYVYGEIESAEPASPPPEPEKVSGFDLFLLSLDAETRELLNDDDLRDIYVAQIAKAKAEKKAEKKRLAIDQASQTARMIEGLVPAEAQAAIDLMRFNAQPMRLKIQLPPADDQGNVADIGLRIDNKVFLDGHTYTCTRAEFDSRREMLYRSAMHEMEFLGMNRRRRAFYVNQRMGNDPRWQLDMAMGDA